jgi:hypothetical protein
MLCRRGATRSPSVISCLLKWVRISRQGKNCSRRRPICFGQPMQGSWILWTARHATHRQSRSGSRIQGQISIGNGTFALRARFHYGCRLARFPNTTPKAGLIKGSSSTMSISLRNANSDASNVTGVVDKIRLYTGQAYFVVQSTRRLLNGIYSFFVRIIFTSKCSRKPVWAGLRTSPATCAEYPLPSACSMCKMILWGI